MHRVLRPRQTAGAGSAKVTGERRSPETGYKPQSLKYNLSTADTPTPIPPHPSMCLQPGPDSSQVSQAEKGEDRRILTPISLSDVFHPDDLHGQQVAWRQPALWIERRAGSLFRR